MKPKVKICCISSLDEANLAIDYGASALGLVGHMPSGPGIISDDLIRIIAQAVPPPIATFLLTSNSTADDILSHHAQVHTNTIQIVDTVDPMVYPLLRTHLPMVKLVQVIHVIDEKSIDHALSIAEYVDALLLDSGNPNLAVKELGGTGRVHNWNLSKQIVDQSPKPVFLAGGLRADNIKQAIDTVQPYGVDLCSGVRTQNKLDEAKLELFMKRI